MKKIRFHSLLFIGCSFFFFTLAAQKETSKKTFTFQTEEGISLEQDVYFPTDEKGPFPTILIRTPYGKQQYQGDGLFFASKGYATVIQDVRGKFASAGHFIPFIHETEDGLSTLDWVADQDWSNGKVSIYGISYSGFCGVTLANKNHPALKSIVNFSGWVNPSTMASPGGANHLMLNLTWLLHEETTTKRNLLEYELDSLFNFLPLAGVFRSIGIQSDAWEDPNLLGKVNQDYDYSSTTVPVLHLTGAYDFVKEATLEAFTKMREKGLSSQGLIFGPWFHNQSHTSLTEVGEVDFGTPSLYGDDKVRHLATTWFERHMNKIPLEKGPLARIFLMFDNNWYDLEEWPLQELTDNPYYLSSSLGANSASGDGKLSVIKGSSKEWDSYLYDPAYPVPTNGGANFHFFPAQLGIKDQTELEERTDLLVYTSPVFNQEYAVIGVPTVQLYVASSAPDTDFTAKLVLLAPDGMAMNISDGILRMRHRDGYDQEALMEAEKIYPIEIYLGTTAFKIPKGHQIRLEISSSNFPKYNRNTNTAIDPFYAKSFQKARQKVYHSEAYPSQLILPMIDMNTFKKIKN